MNKKKTVLKRTEDVFSVSKYGESLGSLFKLVTTFAQKKGKVHKAHLSVPQDSLLASYYISSGTIQKTS